MQNMRVGVVTRLRIALTAVLGAVTLGAVTLGTVTFGAVTACLSLPAAFGAESSQTHLPIARFALSDIYSQKWSLDAAKDKQIVVVAFVGTECPLAKLYGPRLAQLASEYAGKSVAFVAIDS